jgi:hypothetical protein
MGKQFFLIVPLIAFGLAAAGCSRGGRSPNYDQQTYSSKQPPPGSGQTGPGDTKHVNAVNGPKDSAR